MSVILAMILNSSVTVRIPVNNLSYRHHAQQNEIVFADRTTGLYRSCVIGQYGIYWKQEAAYQIAGCGNETIFVTGHEVGEYNKPK